MPLLKNTDAGVTELEADGDVIHRDPAGNFHVPHGVYNELVGTGTWIAGTEEEPASQIAAHVDPTTGTVAQVVNALIAAGLMEPAP